MKQRRLGAILIWLAFTGVTPAGEPRLTPAFAKKPAVSRDGDKVKIDFAVDRETDVAVFIENAKGQIVRHLVAGVLGKSPPEPLRPNSLEQSVTWDGRDDLDKQAAGGPFRVSVKLGLEPVFGKLIGYSPSDVGGVRGLAPAPDGKLYVFHSYGGHHPHDASTAVCVFGRDGKYLKTLVPYPANLPDEKLKGLKRIELDGGTKVPFIYQIETLSMIPGLGDLPTQRPVVARDGRLAFVGILEGPNCFAQPDEARLVVIGTDGGVPEGGALKTLVCPVTDSAASLALSPDEKTLYAAGLRIGEEAGKPGPRPKDWDHGETWKWTKPAHAVYRFGWDDKETKVFVGNPQKSGKGPTELDAPKSVAVDGDGNVYVADGGNNRISVFRPDARPLAQVAVDKPIRVEVHRKTGAIYVLCDGERLRIVKFDGYQDAKRVAELALPAKGGGYYPTRRPLIALDDSADPAVVYTSSPFLRIEDRGNSFGEPMDLRPPGAPDKPNSIAAVAELSLDRQRDILYINNRWRYHVADGQWEAVPQPKDAGSMWPANTPYSASGTMGLDGNYYVNLGAHGARIFRFGPDLKLQPFAKGNKDEGYLPGFARTHGQGHTADPFGNVYALWKKSPTAPGDFHRATALYVYDSNGELKKEKVVDASIPSLHSVRVDYAGNIYLAVGLRPGKEVLPPGLKGRLPESPEDPDAVNQVNGYPLVYGSIVKFGPEGGVIREGAGGVTCNYGHGRRIEVQGAKWIFPGASTVFSWATPKGTPGTLVVCMCQMACFDVDGFGRSFFADAGRYRVGVVDTAGNQVCCFGSYGNQDSAGPGSLIAAPAIPLAWPQAVAVGDEAAYIGDHLNRRILRVRLSYRAEATCEVK